MGLKKMGPRKALKTRKKGTQFCGTPAKRLFLKQLLTSQNVYLRMDSHSLIDPAVLPSCLGFRSQGY